MTFLDRIFQKGKPAPVAVVSARPSVAANGQEQVSRRKVASGGPTAQSTAVMTAQPTAVVRRAVPVVEIQVASSTEVAPVRSEVATQGLSDLDRTLETYTGEVLSAAGGKFQLPETHRTYSAVLEKGLFVYAKGQLDSTLVRESIRILRQGGFNTTNDKVQGVDLATIRTLYQNHTRRAGNRAEVPSSEALNQLNQYIQEAAAARASDIRIRVLEHEATVAMRRLGSYEEMKRGQIHSGLGHQIVRAAFANAAISDPNHEELRSQSAQVVTNEAIRLPDGINGLRLEFAPLTQRGRLLTIRLLAEEKSDTSDIDRFGYAPIHLRQIKRMRRLPSGLVLISAPTGHGKSTTLKKCLEAINRHHQGRKNIISVENPVEYTIEGISQIPVWKAKTAEEFDAAFNEAIRSMLRSDPDIIMVGEIRDRATAKLIFKTAMSGHLSWSTIHTPDAISIPARLMDEGVERHKLSNPKYMAGMIAQRLVRVLCEDCRVPLPKARDADSVRVYRDIEKVMGREDASKLFVSRAGGCANCKGDGYKGRSVVAETILPDYKLMRLILADDMEAAMDYWLNELEGLTMQEHGLAKAMHGLIDLRDVESELGPLDVILPSRADKIREFSRTLFDAEEDTLPSPPLVAEVA